MGEGETTTTTAAATAATGGTNIVAVHIVTGFLFIILFFLIWHAVRRTRVESLGIILNPFIFFPLFLLVSALFTALLGLSKGLLAAALAGGFVLGLSHPMIAVSFFVANILLRPWELMPPNILMEALPRLLASQTMLSWLIYRIRARDLRITWNPPVFYFVGFLVWCFLSSLTTYWSVEAASWYLSTFLPIAVTAFIVLNSASDALSVKMFRGSIVLAITGIIAISIYLTLTESVKLEEGNRLSSLGAWSNANDLAALIVLALPLGVMPWMMRSRSAFSFLVAGACAAVLLYGLWLSQSRGAIIALGLGIFASFVAQRKISVKTAPLLAVMAIVPMALYFGIHREEADLQGSSSMRFAYAEAGIRMVIHHPVFGVGLGNYPWLFERYTDNFGEWGERTAHSSWVLALAETGFMGFFFFVALYISVLRRAWRVRKDMPELFLAMITYGVAMSFLSHTYLIPPYLLYALVLGAYRAFQATPAPTRKLVQRSALAALALFLFAAPHPAAAEEPFSLDAVNNGNKPLGDFVPPTSKTLELKGARGETRNFMLLVGGTGCAPLNVSPFKSSSGSGSFEVNLFAMKTMHTENPSFTGAFVGDIFDPLIPLPKPTLCARVGTKTWIWGELTIPKTASAGEYNGTFALPGATLPVHVTVWKMEIPERFALPAYSELTTWFNVLGHYGKWHEGEAELADKYSKAMIAHRIIPVKSSITMAEPKDDDGGKPTINLTSFPDADQSFVNVTLKNRPTWAYYDFPSVGGDKIDDPKTMEYFEAVQRALAPLNRPGKAFFYLWDEPKPEQMPSVRHLAALAHRLAPSVKVMVTTTWQPDLDKLVDIFCPVMDEFAPLGKEEPETYKKIKSTGHEFWWYVSCMSHGCDALADSGTPDMVMDRPAVYIRVIPWLSAVYGADAFLYYSVNNGYQFYPKRDPWVSLWDFSGNGDGTLFYPGRPGENGQTEHGPIPSVRLKLWREASFDAEYIHWMQQQPNPPQWFTDGLHTLASSVTEWSRDYNAYDDLRNKIGDYLNSH